MKGIFRRELEGIKKDCLIIKNAMSGLLFVLGVGILVPVLAILISLPFS